MAKNIPQKLSKHIPAGYSIFLMCSMLVCFTPRNLYAKAGGFTSQPPTLYDVEENIDPQETIRNIRRAIAQEPENHEHYGALALACDYVGDYPCELEALKSAVKYLPADDKEKDIPYGNLGRAYILNGLSTEGKAWLDKADAINPDNIYNRWHAFNYQVTIKKDLKAAADELKKIDALYEKEWDVYHEAGRIAFDNLPRKDVLRLFKEAVRADPGSAKARRALGITLRGAEKKDFAKNLPAAMKEFKKAIALDPQYIPT